MGKRRYITRAEPNEYAEAEFYTLPGESGLTVFEPEDEGVNTGLLDSNGTPIYRLPDRRKIGF